MLISAIRESVSCNLRRIAACVTYRNKMRTKIARQCESNLLSISHPNIAACRIYSTESDSKPFLPMLVTDAKPFIPSVFISYRIFFLYFKTIRHIDKEFDFFDILAGTKYAVMIISNALANEDYDSLKGLVAEDMIEILRTKIRTLSPEQRRLIAAKDFMFLMLSDISARADEEHSIEIKMIYHYLPGSYIAGMTQEDTVKDAFLTKKSLICNYTFFRKYVNNVGDSWIATFVNHYSLNAVF